MARKPETRRWEPGGACLSLLGPRASGHSGTSSLSTSGKVGQAAKHDPFLIVLVMEADRRERDNCS